MFMYKVLEDQLGGHQRVTLFNSDTGERVSIVSSLGANINSMVLCSDKNLLEVLNADQTFEELQTNCCFKSAKLTPFPNRTKDGLFILEGNNYELDCNFKEEGHAIHGLVWNKPFRLLEKYASADFAFVRHGLDYGGENKGYPFKFRLVQTTLLNEKGVEIITEIVNSGSTKLPIGDGWHPYFKLNEPVDSLELRIPSNNRIDIDSRMIPTGKMYTFDKFQNLNLIKDTSFDTGFKLEKDGISITEIYSEHKDVSLNIWQESDVDKYNFLQIYIPPDRQSIAVEPMTCETNALNSGNGLLILGPGECFTGRYGVFIQ